MNVIAGRFKNRPLKSPKTAATHPMGAREKNALFNSIAPYGPFKNTFDAYAGSGALGIEALSRNLTDFVLFCDQDQSAVKIIKQNLANLGAPDLKTKIVKSSLKSYLKNTATHPCFNLILADPPYDKINSEELLGLTKILEPSGLFVLSHPSSFNLEKFLALANNPTTLDHEKTPQNPSPKAALTLISSRHYAAANITIFQKPPSVL